MPIPVLSDKSINFWTGSAAGNFTNHIKYDEDIIIHFPIDFRGSCGHDRLDTHKLYLWYYYRDIICMFKLDLLWRNLHGVLNVLLKIILTLGITLSRRVAKLTFDAVSQFEICLFLLLWLLLHLLLAVDSSHSTTAILSSTVGPIAL